MIPIILAIFSYLLGSISTSIIICRVLNLPDPRITGSNNAGATNVLRIAGKKVAIITLLGDILKGMSVVAIGMFFGLDLFSNTIIGLFAILGHMLPIFFKFKGGKGVATFIGVLLMLNLYSGLVFLAVWLFIAKIVKISSLSALVATALSPLYFYYFSQDMDSSLIIVMISLLIFWTHRTNIKRIITKNEDSINVK